MAEIKILDDKTINQIAAGEVVERPVSVVKELVENAIDAGATNISVEIKDGGTTLIRVTDNGSGIDKNNIRTAFLRHATSKIKSVEDLFTVKSLGFRGEALSSIAAVSQIELLTKVKDEIFGLRYCLSGGREDSLDEVGVPDGTTIIVRNLFFNTPARRKFLKSPMTEGNYISDLMERLVLSHPEIGFKYIVNGREKIVSTGNNDVRQNIYSLFGREIAGLILPIEYDNDDFSIKGFVGKPEVARGNRNFELIFVNNRCIKCNTISKALEEAYKPFLMMHKYPFVVLYLDVSPEDIDVNVHPAKTEIKFYKESDILSAITECINSALTSKELIREVKGDNKIIASSVKATAQDTILLSENITNPTFDIDGIKTDQVNEDIKSELDMIKGQYKNTDYSTVPEPFELSKIKEFKANARDTFAKIDQVENIKQENLFEESFLDIENIPKHKIIGQIFDTYWIVEFNDKMFMIDQHAAHEKVLYERIKKRIENDDVFSQNISPAIIVTLTTSEAEIYSKYKENLFRIGFEIEHFGGMDYAITAVPTELFRMSQKEYFLAVLDDLSQINRITDTKQIDDRIASMACKAAIKGDMRFSFAEAKALIDELLQLDNPYNCPHGRPTIISYSKTEIEKLFKRIV